MKKLENFDKTVCFIAKGLKDKQYAIRGTASLVLQGIEMDVSDIDILSDKATALVCNEIFKDYLKKRVEYKKSPKFKSYFGKFLINQIPVEVMGDWQIKLANNQWSIVYSGQERVLLKKPCEVWVSTIGSELSMFADMGRWHAYWKMRRQIDNSKRYVA